MRRSLVRGLIWNVFSTWKSVDWFMLRENLCGDKVYAIAHVEEI
jgi:hypothetical protein